VIAILGAGCVSPWGIGWRQLATWSAPPSLEVPPIAPEHDVADAKARRLMSRAARLATIAARDALAEGGLSDPTPLGFWLGVGASGGPLEEISAMLALSKDGDRVSMERLGKEGLAVTNPLSTFQVLNNFTMCHAAIASGTRGPNGAFFSRGAGTLHALREAMHQIAEGGCEHALVGGADTALHPVTQSELEREGLLSRGLRPAEGAGVLLLGRASAAVRPLAIIEHANLGDWRQKPGDAVVAGWGPQAQEHLAAMVSMQHKTFHLGESLAATPALAWLTGLAWLLKNEEVRRMLIMSRGPDDETVSVVLRRPD
jgi:hypothetical protein